MKTTLVSFVLSGLLLVSCGNKEEHPAAEAAKNTPDVSHSPKRTLDYQGYYKGVLPCADCEGIETELALNDTVHVS